jgi:uncharacterized OB-fold protein
MSATRQGVWPSPIDDPYADETTQPYWDAALEGKLLGYRCDNCGTFMLPPPPFCFNCQHRAFSWVELPGTGEVYSFTIIRHPLSEALRAVVPYVSAVVNVDGTQGAGARMLVNIIDCEPETVRIGAKVRVVFDKVSDTLAVPRFVLVDA